MSAFDLASDYCLEATAPEGAPHSPQPLAGEASSGPRTPCCSGGRQHSCRGSPFSVGRAGNGIIPEYLLLVRHVNLILLGVDGQQRREEREQHEGKCCPMVHEG